MMQGERHVSKNSEGINSNLFELLCSIFFGKFNKLNEVFTDVMYGVSYDLS